MQIPRIVRIISIVVAALLLLSTGFAIAQTIPATDPAAAGATVTAAAPTSQPGLTVVVNNQLPAASSTTQPAVVDNTVNGATRLLTDRLNKLTLEEILDPKYWMSFVFDAIRWTLGFIPRLIVAIFIVCFFWLIYRIVRKLILGSMKAAGVDESIRDMLAHLLKWAVIGFGLIIAGNQIGLEIAALLTGVSIIGLAVGFAAQESLSNFIAGIMIFLDKPFKVGDWIEIDGELGQVRRVTFRSTRLTNLDGDGIVMPNVAMLSNRVLNKSANDITRVRVVVGIAYNASIDHARQTLIALVANDKRVEKVPAPHVDVVNLGASSVDLEFRFWIKEEQYEHAMRNEYMERAKNALDAAGIGIPFPHVQLLLEKTPAVDLLAKRAG